jgi:hypothetical protein
MHSWKNNATYTIFTNDKVNMPQNKTTMVLRRKLPITKTGTSASHDGRRAMKMMS